jgi:hypothetical protein
MADVWTDAGQALVVDILDGTASSPGATGWYVGWGTGAGTAAVGDTTLSTEASESRVQVTCSQPAANQSRYVGTITADGTKTITNAGIFNASTSGTLWLHSDFTGVALNASDSIQFTFTVTWKDVSE